MKRLNKAISSIGLAAFVAVLLAGAANTASAAILAEKAFHRDGAIKTTAAQDLSGSVSPVVPSVAEATYFAPGIVIAALGPNDENLVDEVPGDPITYGALFDIFVYDVDNSAGSDPTLFKNDLASIAANAGVPPGSVTFGVANLRFTWYAGAFDVLTSTTAATDLDFSLAAASNAGFFDAGNRLVGCGDAPCASPGFTPATWKITSSDGVLDNSTAFYNDISKGSATLLVTGSIIEPGGGGYVNIITALPEPSALTFAALSALSLLGLSRRNRYEVHV